MPPVTKGARNGESMPESTSFGGAFDQLRSEEFSWKAAVGGWRGVIESALPVLVFVIVFLMTSNLWVTAAAASAIALIFFGVRILSRQPVTQALSGLMGVAIGVVWALASGREENYFAVGLVNAALFFTVLVLSLVLKKPLMALGCGVVWQLPSGWMKEAAHRPLYRRCVHLTWLWAALFLVRFIVQLPLWWFAMLEALAAAKLVLGIPLFAIVVWVTWMGLRPFAARYGKESDSAV